MVNQVLDRTANENHPPRMTYEEFLAWIPDGKQAEWVDGEVIVLTTTVRHVRFSAFLAQVLRTTSQVLDAGEVFEAPCQMKLNIRPAGREPDILFVRKEHSGLLDRIKIDGPADLVIDFCPMRAHGPIASSNIVNMSAPACPSM